MYFLFHILSDAPTAAAPVLGHVPKLGMPDGQAPATSLPPQPLSKRDNLNQGDADVYDAVDVIEKLFRQKLRDTTGPALDTFEGVLASVADANHYYKAHGGKYSIAKPAIDIALRIAAHPENAELIFGHIDASTKYLETEEGYCQTGFTENEIDLLRDVHDSLLYPENDAPLDETEENVAELGFLFFCMAYTVSQDYYSGSLGNTLSTYPIYSTR